MLAIPISAAPAGAARPSAADALKLKPIQNDVDYDTPSVERREKCSIDVLKAGTSSGWEVRDPDGRVLRRFLDTNRDNKVDQWCYFKDGIEVYRDIDSNYNRKADQYRWLGTAGTRWGLDTDEDGRIDRWKAISAEEVSAEVIAALRTHDARRFQRLLPTDAEIKSLGLGMALADRLRNKVTEAATGFDKLARAQKFVTTDTQWVNFGGTRPGIVPAGTNGSTKDLEVYENTAAIVQRAETPAQVLLGTLVNVDGAWRAMDLPQGLMESTAGSMPDGFFFQSSLAKTPAVTATAGGLSPEVQKLVNDLESIDKNLATQQTPEAAGQLNARRADVLQQLAKRAANAADRATWIRQLADTVGAAAQSGTYPDGIRRLQTLYQELDQEKAGPNLVAYVKYRFLSADYGQRVQEPNADFAKIQQQWLENLEQFVKDYPQSADAPEAMLQLAVAKEFAGQEKDAVQWYGRIISEFPETTVAAKAVGAKRRIESVGKALQLQGKDLSGQAVSVSAERGKVVLIHYWATWCEPCKQDLSLLKDMLAKYGQDKLALIGVNVDSRRADLDAYLAENPLSWPQLYEAGGMDSHLATELGILTLPTMILIDADGNVVRRDLHATEVDRELRKLLR